MVTWRPQRSKWGKGEGCSSVIGILYCQCFRLKWFLGPLQVRDGPGNPGKGYCGSKLTWIDNLLASEQFCRVSRILLSSFMI